MYHELLPFSSSSCSRLLWICNLLLPPASDIVCSYSVHYEYEYPAYAHLDT